LLPDAPQLIAFWLVILIVGPAIGYLVGGLLLKLDTDFDRVVIPLGISLTEKDDLWVGAW
jgi:hypothetical protein